LYEKKLFHQNNIAASHVLLLDLQIWLVLGNPSDIDAKAHATLLQAGYCGQGFRRSFAGPLINTYHITALAGTLHLKPEAPNGQGLVGQLLEGTARIDDDIGSKAIHRLVEGFLELKRSHRRFVQQQELGLIDQTQLLPILGGVSLARLPEQTDALQPQILTQPLGNLVATIQTLHGLSAHLADAFRRVGCLILQRKGH